MYQPGRVKSKIRKLHDLKQDVNELKKQGKKVVFTNGCFDLLHAGHVRLLREAKSMGDVLIVGINSDSSVNALKGLRRPVIPHDHRAEVVAALESVDYVVIFNELDPLRTIEEIVPGVLVKGGDWDLGNIIGREVVEKSGGSVISIPLMEGVSTTCIIKRIIELYCN
jgi:D-beta-D-heptose 7-phosphate kinase/D-beta-D-heptose 1-phosphate adenosyltransferase